MKNRQPQLKHTDEDVIAGGQCYRIPRKVNDNITSLTGEAQGKETLRQIGLLDVEVEPKEPKPILLAEGTVSQVTAINDIDNELPHKTPTKGVSHDKSPPKKKSG